MPSKEQTHKTAKASAKRSPEPATREPFVSERRQTHLPAIQRLAEMRPEALSPDDVLQLQRAIGNRATGRLLAQANRRPPQQEQNRTGLPDALKAGIENLSGLAMDDVRVHYNSSKPARMHALAYTQGTEIHVGPGQERHLPHEAWHVVQQRQGRVRPTAQVEGHAVNDEGHLEAEADVMSARAARMPGDPAGRLREASHESSNASRPYQLAKGGLEYTEKSPNVLARLAGTEDLITTVGYRAADMTLRGAGFKVYHVPAASKDHLGAQTAADDTVWKNGMVKLTNDTNSPEWIIEAHGDAGTDRQGMTTEITKMFAMRTEMRDKLKAYKATHAGEIIAFVPEAEVASELFGLFTPYKTFVYEMTDVSEGAAQITFKYTQKPSLKRIAEVNVSRYLKGGAIRDDLSYLGKTSDYNSFTKLFASDAAPQAQSVRAALVANSIPFAHQGVTYLSAEDVGVTKLMVINDAMATLVVRFNATFGQSRDKNLQRFFPKSRRPDYVHAMAGRKVPDAVLDKLRGHLMAQRDNMTSALKAELDLGSIDISTIANAEVAEDARAELGVIMIKIHANTATTQERAKIDKLIFGKDDGKFRTKLTEVINAYTEQAGEEMHKLGGPREAVVKSMNYADVDATNEPGAVYELRDKEILMSENDLNAINAALDVLFAAV